jgi:hypothetical protein
MAISLLGSTSTAATSGTIPGTYAAGDMIVVFAFRNTSTTVPTLGSGFTSLATGSGNTAGARLAFKRATSSSESSGTWTNATSLIILTYSGVAGIGKVGGGNPSATGSSGNSTTVTYPTLTLDNASGSSYVVGVGGHRDSGASMVTAPTGMTNITGLTSGTTGRTGAHDTNGGVTSWSSQNVAVGGSAAGWLSFTLELIASASFPYLDTITPTSFASSVTSMPIAMPASTVSGQRLHASVSVRNPGTWSTIPTGWSQLAQQTGGGSASQLTIFEKIADGTEGGTTPTWIASVSTTAIWQVASVVNAHASTASEVATTSGDATAADPPSLTPSWGADNTLWSAVAGHAAASAAAFTAAPANYTGFLNSGASSGGSAVSVATATRQLNATSENPGAFTAGGSNRFWAAATIAVRPVAAGGGTTVTPGVAALTTTGYAPTILLPQTVTPGVASLSLTTFAPAIGTGVVPGLPTLTLTTFAPAISVSDNKTATPDTLVLTTIGYAPTVTTSDHKTVIPSTATLNLTAFAPTVIVGVVVTPDTALLTTTSHAPTILTPVTVVPGAASLTTTTFAPNVTAGISVVPGTASISITTFAPTVSLPVTAIPGVANITLTSYSPTVLTPSVVSPATISLALTLFAPTVDTTHLPQPLDFVVIRTVEDNVIIGGIADSITIKDKVDNIMVRTHTDGLVIRGDADSASVLSRTDSIVIRTVEDSVLIVA